MITIVVPGVPVAQGSKMPYGGEANPHVKAWRSLIAEKAAEAAPNGPLTGPVAVYCSFYFPRPAKHFRTGKHSDELRTDAPTWHSSAPDLDKLQRAIGDALKGVVLRDDRQICVWRATKRYSLRPRVEIVIREPVGSAPSLGS